MGFDEMPGKHLSRELKAKLMEEYLVGEKVEFILAEHRIPKSTLRRVLDKSGVPRREVGRPRKDHLHRDWLLLKDKF